MLKAHTTMLRRVLALFDMVVVADAFVLAYLLVGSVHPFHLRSLSAYAWPWAAFVVIWLLSLSFFGSYASFRIKRVRDVLLTVLKSGLLAFSLFGSLMFLFHSAEVSRLLVATAFVSGAVALSLQKVLVLWIFHYTRRRGFNQQNVLVVGTGQRAQRVMEHIRVHAEWGLRIIGLVDEDPELQGRTVCGYPVLGTLDDVSAIIHHNVLDEVVCVVPRSWLERLERLVRVCETEGVKISISLDLFDLTIARSRQTDFDGLPLLTLGSAPDAPGRLIAKRLIDVALSSAALLALSPVFALIALLIRSTGPGTLFFRQVRCGLNGRRFTMYKFRTMVPEAEQQLDTLLARNEMQGPVFKLADDPRVTPLGRWLRKLSLDELPQLWNVLRGDMSLVGPRPPLPSEVAQYDAWQRRKLSMRPGVTCLWQISGRNNITDFNDWVKLDLKYIDSWSLLLDWKILLKTVPAVVVGVGAK